jgi:hypothetical protein
MGKGDRTMAHRRKQQPQRVFGVSATANPIGPTRDDIASRAYQLYEARGGVHGYDSDDWFQAERELRQQDADAAA